MRFDKGYISVLRDRPGKAETLHPAGQLQGVHCQATRCRCSRRSSEPVSRADHIAEDVEGEAPSTPGRQQDPRHLRRARASRLRRPPQGDAQDMVILTGGQGDQRRGRPDVENADLFQASARKVVVTR